MMEVRKQIRIEQYDYAAAGAYFVTVCTAGRAPIFWDKCIKNTVGADSIRPSDLPLSPAGRLVEQAICQISEHYPSVCVDKYCIMPDHIHMIVRLSDNGRMISAPTLSTIVGQMKRWVSKRLGRSVWQKSFYDHAVRNRQDYAEIWQYIENNPLKYLQK